MPSGEAPIAEASTVEALLSRQWSRRRPLPTGILSVLTLVFWAVWLYLVLPLVSLVLWFFGVRFFAREIAAGGSEGLRSSLLAYSSVLAALIAVLALWIAWNVARYGGGHDRRTVKSTAVSDPEVQAAFHLDDSLLAALRGERMVRVDLDGEGCVVMLGATPTGREIPTSPAAAEAAGPPPQRGPESEKSR
jgi:poly-beta-1,6-N-acetyl-D-glucosamine biosynthesis protein PgaD